MNRKEYEKMECLVEHSKKLDVEVLKLVAQIEELDGNQNSINRLEQELLELYQGITAQVDELEKLGSLINITIRMLKQEIFERYKGVLV